MLTSAALIFSALMATAVGNYTFPYGFDIDNTTLTERSQWCTAERNSCPLICGGVADENTCDATTLAFTCVCSNGSEADVALYEQTVPFYVCQATYAQCIEENPNNLDAQESCKANETCGTLNASAVSTTSTAASTASATASASTTTGSSSTTASASSSATSSGAAAALRIAQDHSTSLLVGAFLVAFRVML
ncbi:hypothetical protein ASPZODRAFT_136856 [Penicilliopsis zonata CBS 506.65]|uniref:DUF7707 domain-containing protein n=1 Tax=Penicilliopsis zonata CBS 506.65 TaxID=1073090 RepID=A0A1L9S747_9EURO|nr:hypothetical protein ASPZODRAFT_136856 [Penicilliopsis zonata CBS 506.65]OJJ42983.1 hypothetical protein ASPZODRAFT_136856 [Penicilliopsis zonata CBS 506.65]